MTNGADGGFSDDQIEELVAEMLGAPAARPVRWAYLYADDAEHMLTDLAQWVCWLVARYQLDGRELPSCWWRHGALIEELTGLWGAWRVAYEGQAAAAMAEWHRIFAETRERIREWAARTGCSALEHRAGTPQPWVADEHDEWWQAFTTGVREAQIAEPARSVSEGDT
ncbi:hypothetical protein [Phytoactinopolyspora halotolerans]|uniref:DUF4913 domain-containing protein n=1 Tax=Phytoactinopolyspora halotolerans TaxID=1981512 RepID=A0A6L9S925_9ACTN|nr:hypothetical protein [Phytoactinopolyspora halotolerans]NEE01191.1 hypothetical protein [Phytoactinopolyspora halotolerans]